MSFPYTTTATATPNTPASAHHPSASPFAHHITTTAAATSTAIATPLLFWRTSTRAKMNNHHDYYSHDHHHQSSLDGSQWLGQYSDEEDIFSQLVPAQINSVYSDTSSLHLRFHQQHQQQHPQLLEQEQVEEQHGRHVSSGAQTFHSFDDFNSPASSYYSAPTERSPFHYPDSSSSVYPFTFGYPYESHTLPAATATISTPFASANTETPIQYYSTPATHHWNLSESPYQALFSSYEAIRDPQSGMHSASSSTSSCHHALQAAGITTCSLPASISLSPASSSSATSSSSIRNLDAFLPALEMTDHEGRSIKRLRSKSDDVREGIPACDFCRKRKVKCDRKRPTCSFCARHGQQCRTEDRLRKRGPPTKAQREEMRRQGLVYDRHKRQWLPTKPQQ